MISAHFSEAEVSANLPAGTPVPASVYAAARELAPILEAVRQAIGAPLRVTSWYRPEEKNEAVGGVAKSQHLTGNAADVIPLGVLLGDAFDRVERARKAGQIPTFGQIIFYPFRLPGKGWGHIHISTKNGTGSLNRVLVVTPAPDGGISYNIPDATLAGELPRAAGSAALGVLVLVLVLAVLALSLL